MKRPTSLVPEGQLSAFERWELPSVESAEVQARRKVSSRVEEVEAGDAGPQPVTAEQIEAIQKAAYDEGFALGRQEGLKAGQAEVQANAQRLAQIAQGLAEPLAELDRQLENELVELALAIGRQLIRRELQTQPDEVVGVVREAIGSLPSSASSVKLFLHPDDARLVRESLSLPHEDGPSLHIVEDPVLSRGGCRVESERSRVDATLEHRLNSVVAKLFGGERESDRDPQT